MGTGPSVGWQAMRSRLVRLHLSESRTSIKITIRTWLWGSVTGESPFCKATEPVPSARPEATILAASGASLSRWATLTRMRESTLRRRVMAIALLAFLRETVTARFGWLEPTPHKPSDLVFGEDTRSW